MTLFSGQRHRGHHEFNVFVSTVAVAADQRRVAHTEEAEDAAWSSSFGVSQMASVGNLGVMEISDLQPGWRK